MAGTALHLQEQLAQIRAEKKRLQVAEAVRADAEGHAQQLDDESLHLHRTLDKLNAQIARLQEPPQPAVRKYGWANPADVERNIIMLRKRNAALSRILDKCSDPGARMREEEELRRLQGEVHATERRLELRDKELRQLNRQAGRLLRQREEAAWHKRDAQVGLDEVEARHIERLGAVEVAQRERYELAMRKVEELQEDRRCWLQPLVHAAQLLRTRRDAPYEHLRQIADEPSPALALIDSMRRMTANNKEWLEQSEKATRAETAMLQKLERLHTRLVQSEEIQSEIQNGCYGFPCSPSAAPADENGLHGDSSPKKTRKVPPLAVGRTAAVRAVAA